MCFGDFRANATFCIFNPPQAGNLVVSGAPLEAEEVQPVDSLEQPPPYVEPEIKLEKKPGSGTRPVSSADEDAWAQAAEEIQKV